LSAAVLVVDDDADIRTLVADVLEEHGYRVYTAADGYTALQTARAQRPDMVLLDVFLELGPDGIAVRYALSADQATLAIPVVFLTALAPDQIRERGGDGASATPILRKPFTLAALLACVAKHAANP
jgi:CheY-like chemotaxis protein